MKRANYFPRLPLILTNADYSVCLLTWFLYHARPWRGIC